MGAVACADHCSGRESQNQYPESDAGACLIRQGSVKPTVASVAFDTTHCGVHGDAMDQLPTNSAIDWDMQTCPRNLGRLIINRQTPAKSAKRSVHLQRSFVAGGRDGGKSMRMSKDSAGRQRYRKKRWKIIKQLTWRRLGDDRMARSISARATGQLHRRH